MTIRAKMKLVRATDIFHTQSGPGYRTLRFETQYDPAIPEDMRFQKATPTGYCEMQVDNPAALAQFEIGRTYYVDFIEDTALPV